MQPSIVVWHVAQRNFEEMKKHTQIFSSLSMMVLELSVIHVSHKLDVSVSLVPK